MGPFIGDVGRIGTAPSSVGSVLLSLEGSVHYDGTNSIVLRWQQSPVDPKRLT